MNLGKHAFIMLSVLVLSLTAYGQIPNAGFEQWTSGNPQDWFSTNLPGLGIPVTQVTPGHNGTWAVKGEVITTTLSDTMAPLLASGQYGDGFPVNERHGALNGYYQFGQEGDDIVYVTVLMYRGNTYLGGGIIFISNPANVFTPFTVPITYTSNETPDKCIIQIAISNSGGVSHPGSYYIVDDLILTGATGIAAEPGGGHPGEFALFQNYPNPFNPSTTISFEIPNTEYTELRIFTIQGALVKTLVAQELSKGAYTYRFDAGGLTAGTYYMQLTAGPHRQVRKMILLR